MQGKNFTYESFFKNTPVSHQQQISAGKQGSLPPIVCVLIQGGEALRTAPFLRRVLGIPGATYLVVDAGPAGSMGQHPKKEADLCVFVQQHTIMPVLCAEQGTVIEVNQVYVVNPELSIQYADESFVFRLGVLSTRGDGMVDHFLAAVAAEAPDRHIVLVPQRIADQFSGGLRVVRAEGGFVLEFTEDEDDIFLASGPGLMTADLILTPMETAIKLRLLLDGIRKKEKLVVDDEQDEAELARIYLQLLRNRGMDFARRRQAEVLRRIQRRMMIHGAPTLKEYAGLAEEEAEEIALFEELRNSMAGFFLDATVEHAFITDILPRLLENHGPANPLRIWIPCCCGGQEAYGLAIFLSEFLHEHKKELTVQIFATDLNKASGERSRMGVYEQSELTGLSSRKRKQYFVKSPAGYHVGRSIREMCVFATQNLFKDPPFSHVDIVVGSSALRGLGQESQERALRTFHYALRSGGFLLSDDMESRTGSGELFQLLRNNPSVFIRKERAGGMDPIYPLNLVRTSEREADNVLLTDYVPPTLLVDDQLRVIRFYGNTEPYLRFSQDRPSLHVLRMVRDELVFELEELIDRSDRSGGIVVKNGVQMGVGAGARQVSVEVTPLRPSGGKWKLVIIRETADAEAFAGEDKNSGRTLAQKDQRILSLEKEAGELRNLLLAAGEDATRIQRTLQVANEEIMASNEELQSVNEQLQSVNQQLLSFNVELNTVNEDLSERIRELESSVEYAHAVVGSLRQPMVVLHEDLRVRLANEPFCKFFGTSVEDTQGQSLYTVANGILDRDELRKALRQMLSKKLASTELEMRVELGGRGERMLTITAIRMAKVKNIRQGLVLALEDISERKAAEKFKDEFIGIASHELKTPATSIHAYSQLLYEELAGTRDKQSAELAMKLTSQVARLTRLTKDLLDVTRINQGQVDLRKDRMDLDEMIRETVEELQVTTPMRLVITGHPPLPQIKGDRDRLRQVFVNLLGNAIKYAPGSPEIIIRPDRAGGMVTIAIQDFGAGMSTDHMRKIFDRYYRLDDGGAGGYPGVGLGLYISSEIVRHHGGEIKVSSEKNKGSVFTISLPID